MSVRFWALLAGLVLAGVAVADPVPERYDAPRTRDARGLAELRDPTAAVESLSALLRCCTLCHSGGGGPRLFRGYHLLPSVDLGELRDHLTRVVDDGTHGGWIRDVHWTPPEGERAKLTTALLRLPRPAPPW